MFLLWWLSLEVAFIAFFLSKKLLMIVLIAMSPFRVCMSFEISIQVGSFTSSLLSLECSLLYISYTSWVKTWSKSFILSSFVSYVLYKGGAKSLIDLRIRPLSNKLPGSVVFILKSWFSFVPPRSFLMRWLLRTGWSGPWTVWCRHSRFFLEAIFRWEFGEDWDSELSVVAWLWIDFSFLWDLWFALFWFLLWNFVVERFLYPILRRFQLCCYSFLCKVQEFEHSLSGSDVCIFCKKNE